MLNGLLAKRQSRETVNLLPSGFVGSSPTQSTRNATVCKLAKRPDFQSGHRKMCAGSNPVRSTNGVYRQGHVKPPQFKKWRMDV